MADTTRRLSTALVAGSAAFAPNSNTVSHGLYLAVLVVLCIAAAALCVLTMRIALLLAAKNRTHTHIFKAASLTAMGSFFAAAWAVAAARTSEGASPKLFGDDACWTAVLVQSFFLLSWGYTLVTCDYFAFTVIDIYFVLEPDRAIRWRRHGAFGSGVLLATFGVMFVRGGIVLSRAGDASGSVATVLQPLLATLATCALVSASASLGLSHTLSRLGKAAVETQTQRARLLRLRALTRGLCASCGVAAIVCIIGLMQSDERAAAFAVVCATTAAILLVAARLGKHAIEELVRACVCCRTQLKQVTPEAQDDSAHGRQLLEMSNSVRRASGQIQLPPLAVQVAKRRFGGLQSTSGFRSSRNLRATDDLNAGISSRRGSLSVPLCQRGVSLEFLKNFVEQHKIGARMTTNQVCSDVIKSATSLSSSSYYELLQHLDFTTKAAATNPSDEIAWAGRSHYFLSHSWSYRFVDVVGIIEAFEEQAGFSASEPRYYWFDVFVMNQHSADELGHLLGNLQESVSAPGKLLLVVDSWREPAALTRAWCLLELFTAMQQHADIIIGLSPGEQRNFERQMSKNGRILEAFLSSLDANNADATVQADKDMIFGAIRAEPGGFTKFNAVIQHALREALRRVLINTHLGRSTLELVDTI